MSKKKHTTKKAPRRSKVIVIRLTPDLYEELKQKAQKAGKSMSSLLTSDTRGGRGFGFIVRLPSRSREYP